MHFAGCEIKNDTEVDMYICRSVNWGAVAATVGVIGGVVAVVASAGALAAVGVGAAGAEAAGAAAAGAASAGAAEAAGAAAATTIIAGIALTAQNVWSMVGIVGGTASLAATLFGLSPAETKKLVHDLEIAPDGADVIVHTDKSIMDIVEGNSDKDLATAMNMTENQVRDMKKVIKDHKYGAECIAPGKSFKFDTGMFSTWKAHVITENLEEGIEDVWTSFWYGQYSQYKASTLWKNVSAKKLQIAIHKEVKKAA